MAIKSDSNFSSEKARVLGKVDLSRKGNVDEAVAELVCCINSLEDFYTTSSCSGRLVVLQEVNIFKYCLPRYLSFYCRIASKGRRDVIGG